MRNSFIFLALLALVAAGCGGGGGGETPERVHARRTGRALAGGAGRRFEREGVEREQRVPELERPRPHQRRRGIRRARDGPAGRRRPAGRGARLVRRRGSPRAERRFVRVREGHAGCGGGSPWNPRRGHDRREPGRPGHARGRVRRRHRRHRRLPHRGAPAQHARPGARLRGRCRGGDRVGRGPAENLFRLRHPWPSRLRAGRGPVPGAGEQDLAAKGLRRAS